MSEPESEILFDQEALARFLELFESKIATEEERKEKFHDALEECQNHIISLKLKYDILKKYETFLRAKGFASVEQTVNANMDEILKAEQARVSSQQYTPSDSMEDFLNDYNEHEPKSKQLLCMQMYELEGEYFRCFKHPGHQDPCGPI